MKFRVKDDDGRDYVIEELEEEKVVPPEEVKDEGEGLSADEIVELRKLLEAAPKIYALLEVKEEKEEVVDEDIEEEKDEEEEEEITDSEDEEEEEKILETKSCDSKKAFGSIEKNTKTQVDDSLEDNVSDAWSKRYNGGIK